MASTDTPKDSEYFINLWRKEFSVFMAEYFASNREYLLLLEKLWVQQKEGHLSAALLREMRSKTMELEKFGTQFRARTVGKGE